MKEEKADGCFEKRGMGARAHVAFDPETPARRPCHGSIKTSNTSAPRASAVFPFFCLPSLRRLAEMTSETQT
jgi:hypothetical protein